MNINMNINIEVKWPGPARGTAHQPAIIVHRSALPPSPAGSSSSGAFVMRASSSGLVIPTPEVQFELIKRTQTMKCPCKLFLTKQFYNV